jgi:uncharacterized membrane protein
MAGESAAEPSAPPAEDVSLEAPPVPPDRLNTLADGVFAIAMTLLVLKLGVPVATAEDDLGARIADMWPDFLMYGLSFLVLGVFWLVHHMIFDVIERSDTKLVWLNILFLMFGSLIPFSTALIGEHEATTITALFYGLNMLVMFFMGWSIWVYATSGEPNVAVHAQADWARGVSTMGLIYFAGFSVPLALAFISPIASMIIYGVIVLVFIGFTVVGKGDAVLVWRTARTR